MTRDVCHGALLSLLYSCCLQTGCLVEKQKSNKLNNCGKLIKQEQTDWHSLEAKHLAGLKFVPPQCFISRPGFQKGVK